MKLIATMAILTVLSITGAGDLADQVAIQDEYCDMMKAGVHGNYKNIDCGGAE